MLILLALAASQAAVPALAPKNSFIADAPAISNSRELSVFREACFNGQVRLTREESKPVAPELIPSALARHYKGVPSISYYKLASAENSYLINFEGVPKGSYKSGCALATTAISAPDLWMSIAGLKVPGKGMTEGTQTLEWSQPENGYTTTVRLIGGGYNVVQLSMLTDAEVAIRLRDDAKRRKISERKKGLK